MIYLTLEQLIGLHVLVVGQTGGSDGVRDMGRLEAAIGTQQQAVFGEELYKTVHDKAAAIIRGIIGDHPFVDGNKRTAMLAGLTLLRVNGQKLRVATGEVEDFAVQVAVEHLTVADIADWLQRHTIE